MVCTVQKQVSLIVYTREESYDTWFLLSINTRKLLSYIIHYIRQTVQSCDHVKFKINKNDHTLAADKKTFLFGAFLPLDFS